MVNSEYKSYNLRNVSFLVTVREPKIGSWEIRTVVKTLTNSFKSVKTNPAKTKLISYSSVKLSCDLSKVYDIGLL